MFDLSPSKLLVLAIVAIIVVGPDRLPGLARDAARLYRTLREMATGVQTQLRDELGPEFADLDLRSLDPRAAVTRALLGEDADTLTNLNPRMAIQRSLFGTGPGAGPGAGAGNTAAPQPPAVVLQKRPALGRDEPAPYDLDAT